MKIQSSINRYKEIVSHKISKWSRKTKIGIASSIIGCITLGAIVFMTSGAQVYSLTIGGKDAGYITDKNQIEKAIQEIREDYDQSDIEITIDKNAIVCQKTDLKRDDVTALTMKGLESKLTASEICTINGWAINVEGNNIAAVSTKNDAKNILSDIKTHYLTAGSQVLSAKFKETVEITSAAIRLAEIQKPEAVEILLLTGEKKPEVYTVKDGDTIWDIAAANGMSAAELQQANPGFDPNKLKIGQQLNLFVMNPYLTVLTQEVIASTEKIDFNTVYEETNTLSRGETKVKTPGVCGSRNVKAEVTKENGVVVATNVIEAVVTAEPQDQVALKGTKAPAAYVASRGGGRSVSVSASGSEIAAYAKKFLGTPYKYGGTSPNGFDCSGFTRYVYSNFGASLPHNSASQYGYGTAVSKSELRPGDLVFFSSSSRISHVGIYVGGGSFIHSPQAGESVKISSFSSSSLRYSGAVRIAE